MTRPNLVDQAPRIGIASADTVSPCESPSPQAPTRGWNEASKNWLKVPIRPAKFTCDFLKKSGLAALASFAFWIGDTGNARAQSLAEAVDNPSLTWSTYGNDSWFGQSSIAYFGGDAAQSGVLTHLQSSTVESSSVAGPATLSWNWKVSSEQGYDFLSFYLDGVLQVRISGESGWQSQSLAVTSGSHSIRWVFSLDGSVLAGQNAAWIDQVQWTATTSSGGGGGGSGTTLSLSDALDTSTMIWSTSGGASWFGQASVSVNGDAAQAGALSHNQSCAIETTITGPGTLSFSWKISSEANYDFLRVTVDGSAIVPGISGEIGWTPQAFAIPGGSHVLKWTYSTDSSVLSGANTAWVDAVHFVPGGSTGASSVSSSPTVSLAEAVDATSLSWSTSGSAIWFGQQQNSYQGGDAAQAGALTHNQATELVASASGPAQLSFAWKVSSENSFDYLRFSIDGLLQDSISGEISWAQKTYALGAGSHTLRWTYSTDGSVLSGSNAGWLDAVLVTPATTPLPPLAIPTSSSDLVWRHRAAGWNGIWYMNNAALERSVLSIPQTLADLDWTIVGTGDFNGDGQNDWVWQHRSLGLMAVWFMNGQIQIGSSLISPSSTGDLNWLITGVGDFNRDGHPDLLFQHATGRWVAIWYMQGVVASTTTLVTPNSTGESSWAVKGVGDFNNDSWPDLLWYHTTYALLAVWYMNNATMLSNALFNPNSTGDLGWDLIDSGDFDRDGRPDLVFEHQSSAQIGIWTMNGENRVGTAFTSPPVPDSTSWQIQAIGHFDFIVPDSDGDGLLDTWERSFFGGLQENGLGDWDADGVNNLAEYQSTSNPIFDLGLQVFTLLK